MDLVVSGSAGRDPDGGVRCRRRHRGGGPRRARHRPRARSRRSAPRSRSCRAEAGKEKLEIEPPKVDPALVEQIRSSHGAKLDEATQIHEKLARQDAAKAVEEEVLEQYASRRGRRGPRSGAAGRGSRARSTSSRRRSSAAGSRSTRSGPTGAPQDEIRPIECEVDISPRVHGSALVHPRGDPDPLQRRARDEPHGHASRQPEPAGVEDLLAPLQLPAVLGRGGGLHARPEAPRHRPRCARRARSGAHDPEPGGLPLRGAGGLGDARVQRVLLDGLGLRLVDGFDGRRRAGVQAGGRASRWG